MGNKKLSLLVLVLVLCYGVLGIKALSFAEDVEDWRRSERGEEAEAEQQEEEEDWRRERGGRGRGSKISSEDWFLLRDVKPIVKTDAGEMRLVKSLGSRNLGRNMHIGFITMEPQTLFIPQYLDSNLIIFIRRGEAKLGFIYGDDLAERRLKRGDVYLIPAGSAFYLVNTGEGQRLHIICSIDTSESLGLGAFRSFFVAGGTYPTSILSGFSTHILENAFNVSRGELTEILSRQQEGPIVYITDPNPPSLWSKFLRLKEQDKLEHLKRMVDFHQEQSDEEKDEQPSWSWRKLLNSVVFGNREERRYEHKRSGDSPDSYNLYKREPDYRNDYGYSKALEEDDYPPLKSSGIGIYLVNLTAGSMMAPHLNPRATEYGIVLRGAGRIEIVFPNGTTAMNAEVKEGDVFWVPRYFPFCQIASRTGPFVFFGFTTTARKNYPQFLVGANSILRAMVGPEVAAAFGASEERYRHWVDAQRESVILPSASAYEPGEGEEGGKKESNNNNNNNFERLPKVIKNFGNDLIMGFD